MKRYVIASDLHGNLEAFNVFKEDIKKRGPIDGLILLGDVIDYGPHSNEVISGIKDLDIPLVCNIRGNHEYMAISGDREGLATEKGHGVAILTRNTLTDESFDFLENTMEGDGFFEFELSGYRCVAIHGSMENPYWGKFDFSEDLERYRDYDYVFTGHSHKPHFFEKYFPADNPKYRNLKKTVFINPGSIGQPRNQCPLTQYAILDMPEGAVSFIRKNYDIKKEQEAFSDSIDSFYKTRLELGL